MFYMKVIWVALLVAFSSCTVVPHVGPIESHVPLTYKVNLEDTPLVRWGPIIKDFQHVLNRMMEFVDFLPIPKSFYDGVQWYAKNQFQHQDFVAEVDAIAQLSGHPFDRLFFLNFMYQFSTFKACTSILVRNSNGKVFHGRNLDFQMWELISKMMVNIEYYKNGEKVFSVDSIAGMVFALTGIRPGAFAITEDTRFTRHFQQNLISVMLDNAIPSAWLVRKIFEEESTYESAVKRLKSERIGGPIYYIISGAKEDQGMVIERNVDSVHAFYTLSEDNWFIVQTNYDRDQKEPFDDQRRVPVELKLRSHGNAQFTEKTMFGDYMSQWPTFNIATILSTVMMPSTGYRNTTIWYGENPKPSEK